VKNEVDLITPDWPKVKKVGSLVTTRSGGFSEGGFAGFNLATHVGDDALSVKKNRAMLRQYLPNEPIWLNQVHGIDVYDASSAQIYDQVPTADAIVTNKPNQVLAILTADCLPILFSSMDGSVIGAAHAGWRGLCAGVIENTVIQMNRLLVEMGLVHTNGDLQVWLGPAISQKYFEVGQEVVDLFINQDGHKGDVLACFTRGTVSGKYLADLHGLAKLRLAHIGIHKVYGEPHCCYEDKAHYFSYRREKVTGRFASLIWIE
jgi:YfiH family protein